MKLDPSITKAREWFAKRAALLGIGALGLLGLLVLAANIHAGIGHKVPAAAPSVAVVRAPAAVAPTPKRALAAVPAIPHIAQQASAAPASTAPTVAPVAIQPPAGLVGGHLVKTQFALDVFGQWTQVSTSITDAQTFSMRGPAEAGQREQWAGWVDLQAPASVAVVRMASGAASVTVTVDGAALGPTVNYYPFHGPASETYSLDLAPGWHSVSIEIDRPSRQSFGLPIDVQFALGDGTAPPAPPQPWAVSPGAEAPRGNPHIAQRPAAASTVAAAAPAAATSAGGAP